MKKIILQEDDCAPDAYQYFENEFIKETKMPILEFKRIAFKAKFKQGWIWRHKGYELSIFYYHLYHCLKKDNNPQISKVLYIN